MKMTTSQESSKLDAREEKIQYELRYYPAILTAEMVCKILSVSKVTAYEEMKLGNLKSFRVGARSIRTTKIDLIKYILEGVVYD